MLCSRPSPAAASRRRRAAASASTAAAPLLPPPSSAGAAARAALLARLLRTPERGIFGLAQAERDEIDALLRALEAETPLAQPTAQLSAVAGDWRLLYTTVTIRGSTRTKLGLRGALTLGELTQRIACDAAGCTSGSATNAVAFSLVGGMGGTFTIDSRFTVSSPKRVDIACEASRLEPAAWQALFEAQLPLLMSLFNPEGWLELTYVDESLRVGRDDKGHSFVLERASLPG